MERRAVRASVAAASGIAVLAFPVVGAAHHPAGEGGGPWFAVLLAVLILALWAVSSGRRRQEKRSPRKPHQRAE